MVRIKKNNFVYNKNIYQCIVPGCQNIDNDTNNPSKIYYYILSENGLQQKLLNTFLENVPIRPKVSRICSEHYTDDCFELQNGVKMLKPNAVPTIRTKQNSTTSIDTNDNIKRTDRPDKIINNMSNEKDINEKQNTKTDDKTLMGPPKTTVVKKSQLQSIQRDPTISPPLLNKNKEVYQHQRRQQECSGNLQQSQQHNGHLQQQLYERSPHLQPHNKHLQTTRQQEQLQQQQCRQQELQQQKQNENILHQQLQQHNGILQQQRILSPHQRQQQHNEELHRRQLLEPLHHKQQQQNCEKLKRQPKTQSKKSPQPNQNKEELKWQQQQKNKKELKQRTKRLQHKQVRSQQQPHNTNLSQRQQGGQSIHKKQQTQIEELQRRQQHEELWHQQIHQHNGNLKERIRTPPQQQHHPQEIQHAHLQNPQHHILNLEDRIQSSHHHHKQLQHGYSPNQHQQQYNEELQHHKEYKQLQYQKQQYHKQQLQQQYEHLQHQQHQKHKEYLELNAKSSHQQQQQYKQMQYVQQQQLLQLQPKQNIFPEHHLLYDRLKTQQQSQPQTSSPIPHEEEHLIMCGYITFESCNNNFSYLCNFCQKNLENLDAFSAHLIRLHSNEIENEINSKASNKGDTTTTTNNLNEENTEKLKCGIINISSKSYNLILNCDFKFDCNFCDKKFEAINKFSEHIGKRHLDLLEKDRENDMEFEDDIDIDPSCILSFDQIDEINGIDTKLNSSMISNNNNSNNKVVMSVPISDNSEIFMTIDINENNNNNNNNSNNKNLNSSYNKESVQQQQQQNISMEFDSIEKCKLRVNIKHSSWATRYFS